MSDFWKLAHELSAANTSFVTVTLAKVRGHAPQEPGARMLVTSSGRLWGTIGGGKVEAKAIALAIEQLQRGFSREDPTYNLVTWNLQTDVGMTCGGEVTFAFEHHAPPSWHITVLGAGHVAQALVRVLIPLPCQILCLDPRQEWIARLPQASNLTAAVREDLASAIPELPDHTNFVVITQGHATDVPILKRIFEHHADPPFVGSIGSEIKASKIRADLREAGIPAQQIDKLRCPIGLPIGGNTPPEIAISIAAQLLQLSPRCPALPR